MAGGWYYAHDGSKVGPISGEHLKELAASGGVLPTDMVWKAGVEIGVSANRIKNLFAPLPLDPGGNARPVDLTPPSAAPTPPNIQGEPAPTPLAPKTTSAQSKPATRAKKASAVALVGAEILTIDGVYARYRMKCTACGHKDSSLRTIQISNKTTKSGFFCPKCRKRREVVIQCHLN